MLWDLLQQSQIKSTRQSADSADLKASLAQANVEQLEAQVQTLSLACQAMWEPIGKNLQQRLKRKFFSLAKKIC
ncbi:hypothetical protein [Cellvibrio sp. PSBB023]|uniref:hypothetical protein n=1 Tax=Cellvibrio sp. PSBB023 TaxID=1945512 RepID=UPI00098E97F3|nr:hypothetical protein [Cellvibrio sp. PSBB023]AQT60455.1 hypothetical protein B0D95_10395 [Cellvibrio sp. PSBB023]